MTRRKLLKAVIGLLLIFAVAVGLTAIKHPIILKWVSGSARFIGRPTNATVYTDGQVNSDIKVFHVDKYWNGEPADYYILYFPYADNSRLQIMSLNRKDNYQEEPVRRISETMTLSVDFCSKVKLAQSSHPCTTT